MLLSRPHSHSLGTCSSRFRSPRASWQLNGLNSTIYVELGQHGRKLGDCHSLMLIKHYSKKKPPQLYSVAVSPHTRSPSVTSWAPAYIHYRDIFPVPNGSGPWTGSAVLFTRDRSAEPVRTGLDLPFCRSNFRSVWICSVPVPCKHLDRLQTVPCKQSPIRSGPVRFGTQPTRSRANIYPDLCSRRYAVPPATVP